MVGFLSQGESMSERKRDSSHWHGHKIALQRTTRATWGNRFPSKAVTQRFNYAKDLRDRLKNTRLLGSSIGRWFYWIFRTFAWIIRTDAFHYHFRQINYSHLPPPAPRLFHPSPREKPIKHEVARNTHRNTQIWRNQINSTMPLGHKFRIYCLQLCATVVGTTDDSITFIGFGYGKREKERQSVCLFSVFQAVLYIDLKDAKRSEQCISTFSYPYLETQQNHTFIHFRNGRS